MFFYNKDMLRKIGKDEAFIEGLPDLVEKGEFTMTDLSNLAKEVVDKGAAQFGILHRPNTGPDYLMTFAAFGVRFVDDDSGQLLLPKAEMQAALEWYDWNARNGVTPENNTAMSWDEIQSAFKQEKAFTYHHGVWALPEWQLGDAKGATWPTDEEGYFEKIGWIHAPAPEKGGEPANLSHPIVYVVNPQSPNAELAAMLVAFATLPYYNTQHAVGSAHTGITQGQLSMPPIRRRGTCRPRPRCSTARPSCPTTPTSAATTASSSRGCRASRPAGSRPRRRSSSWRRR